MCPWRQDSHHLSKAIKQALDGVYASTSRHNAGCGATGRRRHINLMDITGGPLTTGAAQREPACLHGDAAVESYTQTKYDRFEYLREHCERDVLIFVLDASTFSGIKHQTRNNTPRKTKQIRA